MDEIFNKIQKIISRNFDIPKEYITPSTSLIDDVGLDSLDLAELVMDIEGEFDRDVDESVSDEFSWIVHDICHVIANSPSIPEDEIYDSHTEITPDTNVEYDEERYLTFYIWDHYSNLMNPFELSVYNEILKREKAKISSHGNTEKEEKLKKLFKCSDDVEIEKALSKGHDAFLSRVKNRVLNECRESVFINRCPACNKVVRTPKAKLCLWCGNSWH